MGISLVNAKLNGQSGGNPPVQRVKPAATSIAEGAKFIPKPHKRVHFKLETGAGPQTGGHGGSSKDIPLFGQKEMASGTDVSGQNIRAGSLGDNGVSARFNKSTYGGRVPHVKMEVDYNPEKQQEVIATQEEGRQTHNTTKFTHHTQQYDAYGRPRIGFSREPYDFAATKYIVKTSQLKFQQNLSRTGGELNVEKGAAPRPDAAESRTDSQPAGNTLGPQAFTAYPKTASEELELPGQKPDPLAPPEPRPEDVLVLGKTDKEQAVGGLPPAQPLGEDRTGRLAEQNVVSGHRQKDETAADTAAQTGIDFSKLITPEKRAQAAASHDLKLDLSA